MGQNPYNDQGRQSYHMQRWCDPRNYLLQIGLWPYLSKLLWLCSPTFVQIWLHSRLLQLLYSSTEPSHIQICREVFDKWGLVCHCKQPLTSELSSELVPKKSSGWLDERVLGSRPSRQTSNRSIFCLNKQSWYLQHPRHGHPAPYLWPLAKGGSCDIQTYLRGSWRFRTSIRQSIWMLQNFS